VYFAADEWKALMLLRSYRLDEPLPRPLQPPTLREAIREVAGIGGFLRRESNAKPGAETLWRGLTALDVAAFAVQAALNAQPEGRMSFRLTPRSGKVQSLSQNAVTSSTNFRAISTEASQAT